MKYLITLISAYQFVLIIYALLTWMPSAYHTKFFAWAKRLTDPYLSLFRRFTLSFNNVSFDAVIGIMLLDVLKRILGRF